MNADYLGRSCTTRRRIWGLVSSLSSLLPRIGRLFVAGSYFENLLVTFPKSASSLHEHLMEDFIV
jgi:hypothetical protein